MGVYELDDVMVRRFMENVDAGANTAPEINDMQTSLRPQVPIPVPLGVGAIVRTEHPNIGGLFLRWAHDNATHSPWIAVGNHEQPYRTDEIGRIVEVLTPGLVL